jgi:hypothetical protein
LIVGTATGLATIAGVTAATGALVSSTPVLVAASLAGVAGAWLARYFTPKIIARPLYAVSKSGATNSENFDQAINNYTHRFESDYTISIPEGTGDNAVQDGDLILGRAATPDELGLLRLVTTAPVSYVSGFLGVDGKVYDSTDTIPKGTVIPHGTNWNDRGTIPAYTEFHRPVTVRSTIIHSSDLSDKNSVILEKDCHPEADIILSQPATFAFDVGAIAAGNMVPAGTVIPKRTLMSAGTVLPAGTKMNNMKRISRDFLHNAPNGLVSSPGLQLDTITTLRRGIEIPDGILIPERAEGEFSIICMQADGKISEQNVDLKKLPSSTKSGYRVYRTPRGSIHAGSVLPEGTIITGGSELKTASIDAPDIPVNRYLDQDVKLSGNCNLASLLSGASDPKFDVLYLSDDIPGGIGTACVDPINKAKYPAGHDLPKGAYIQANVTLPTDTVIPGGSILKEVDTTP